MSLGFAASFLVSGPGVVASVPRLYLSVSGFGGNRFPNQKGRYTRSAIKTAPLTSAVVLFRVAIRQVYSFQPLPARYFVPSLIGMAWPAAHQNLNRIVCKYAFGTPHRLCLWALHFHAHKNGMKKARSQPPSDDGRSRLCGQSCCRLTSQSVCTRLSEQIGALLRLVCACRGLP